MSSQHDHASPQPARSDEPVLRLPRLADASFRPDALIAGRWRIARFIAQGAMGEVYEAEDLELGERVALKTIGTQAASRDRALARFKREIRLARKVTHPNVCRMFDLGMHRSVVHGSESDAIVFLTMELLHGETLADRLRRVGRMTEAEALPLVRQIADGLAAAHRAGVVHRDFKSSNVVLEPRADRGERLVITDFGLAQGGAADQSQARPATGQAAIVGTPAYMAPEQVAGEPVTVAADLYALGVVMYEMLTGTWPFSGDLQAVLLRRLAQPAPSPRLLVPELDARWEAAILRCLEREPADRFRNTADLVAELEGRESWSRSPQADDRTAPYPGLSAFTEAQADYFFGREDEVELLCEKLRRSTLLGLIGPSGAGKSSFLRAGLLPALPAGWSAVLCQPGQEPFVNLRHALAAELADTPGQDDLLARIEEPQAASELLERWRRRHAETLLVVDAFEELFTLNPPEVQTRFAGLLGGTALECNVRVLVSMRDDFLFHCHAHPALARIFSDLTPLAAPAGAALRRALVQPARGCGYRFEDEVLVEEMLDEVRGEHGALPLLAFAAARLWDARDRERRLLTRDAYRGLGGVSGALAQHAEAALEQIGAGREGIVREIFRNLVTAEGTRAVRGTAELLSVFVDEKEAAQVLRALVHARLLVSYEAASGGTDVVGSKSPEVEVIHESLLAAWPRLVRWRAQDAEGALLRDQLRQAAALWETKQRSQELLWGGASLEEFRVWRKRYPGALSSVEDAFAKAMLEKASNRVRRRRVGLAAVIGGLLCVLAGMGYLYTRSEAARLQAGAEAQRAEASRLLALGRLTLEDNPSAAAAFALSSLELADDPVGRRFALEALWQGPLALGTATGEAYALDLAFSPDGQWLAAAMNDGTIWLWSEKGGPPTRLQGHAGLARHVAFLRNGTELVSEGHDRTLRFWSVPEGKQLRLIPLHALIYPHPDGTRVVTVTREPPSMVQTWELEGTQPTNLARLENQNGVGAGSLDPSGRQIALAVGRELGLLILEGPERGRWIPIGRHDDDILAVAFNRDGDQIAAGDRLGEIRLWSVSSGAMEATRILSAHEGLILSLQFSPDGRLLASASADGTARVWDVGSGTAANPLILRTGKISQMNGVAFHPSGLWLATAAESQHGHVDLWSMGWRMARVFRGHRDTTQGLAFDPSGNWFSSASWDGTVRRWALREGGRPSTVVLLRAKGDYFWKMAVDPRGRFLLLSGEYGIIRLVPTTGESPRVLPGFVSQAMAVAVSPDGGLAAAAGGQNNRLDAVIRLWDIEGNAEMPRLLDPADGMLIEDLAFAPNGRWLGSAGAGGVRLWDLSSTENRPRLVSGVTATAVEFSPDQRSLASVEGGTLVLHSLEPGVDARSLHSHGTKIWTATFHPAGEFVVSGDRDGVVRVGPVSGDEPHLLLGHKEAIREVAVDPQGEWIASSSSDKTVRLWPMPRGRPFHTLPYADLVARLRVLTNLRVVRDPEDPSGYRLELAPFPGWQSAPLW